jgi:hypothetical protein
MGVYEKDAPVFCREALRRYESEDRQQMARRGRRKKEKRETKQNYCPQTGHAGP